MRKLFTTFPIDGDFTLSSGDSHHILTVLRLTIGAILRVTDSNGCTYDCSLSGIDGSLAKLVPVKKITESAGHHEPVVLAAGILKGDKFDWVVQKAVELGVDGIVPVEMAHCVVKLNDKRRQERVERWQRIANEAAKQCGRNDMPEVYPVSGFSALPAMFGQLRFLIPYEKETACLQAACREIGDTGVVICIGPEGGFADQEIQCMEKSHVWYRLVSLGPNILRAETASLAALSIVLYERGFNQ